MSVSHLAQSAKLFWPQICGEPQLIMHRENAVFRVETTQGPAALRIHRRDYHTREEIASELTWMAYLSQAGVALPVPLATSTGAFLAELSDHSGATHVVDLLSWVEGQPLGRSRVPLAYTREELAMIFADVGRNLARLHDLSDKFVPPPGFRRHALDADGFLGANASWGPFWAASVLAPEERTLMEQVREKAREKLAALVAGGADYGLIHADLVRENIFVNGGKTSFIDFDDAGFGFRMFDLAVALVKNRDEPHYPTIKQALFSGYQSIRAIAARDEAALGLFLALRDFAYLGWADARRNEDALAPRMAAIKADTLHAARLFLAQG